MVLQSHSYKHPGSSGHHFAVNFRRLRYLSSVAIMYLATLLLVWTLFKPHPSAISVLDQGPKPLPAAIQPILVSGLPVRIVIPSVSIDLPIEQGFYDKATNSWTLTGYHAQFAMPSRIANNQDGETFIYGHNNRFVFGPIKYIAPGAQALIYTDNGHIFSYNYETSANLYPTDVSVLKYQGPPILAVQTCAGSLNEWRQIFKFNFGSVVQ